MDVDLEQGAIVDEPAAAPPDPEPAGEPVDELTLARDLVLRAHPDTVEELIRGESLAELLASVPAARAAYQRVAATTRAAAAVPGGGAIRSASVNIEALGPLAKIRAGLARD